MDKIFNILEKHIRLPRFWAYVKDFINRFQKHNVPATGAQLAYYLVLSFFPFLIFLLMLIPYTRLGNEDVLSQLMAFLPETAADLVEPIINDVVNTRSGALLSTALILTLWSASSGINNLLTALDTVFDADNTRNFVIKRAISLASTLMLVLIIIVTLGTQVFGQVIVDLLAGTALPEDFLVASWFIIRNLVPLLIMIIGFAFLYRFGPAFPKDNILSFREAILGGVIAGVGWTVISMGFSFYVSNFGNYANTYGSIGGMIVLLIWLFLSSMVIMVGAVATASYIAVFKNGKTGQGEVIPLAETELNSKQNVSDQ